MLLAVDCIIFGFDGTHLKLLLIKRSFQPQKGRWSLMGGFVMPDEKYNTLESIPRLGTMSFVPLHMVETASSAEMPIGFLSSGRLTSGVFL